MGDASCAHYDMYARHDVIIGSACLWLEDVNSNSNSNARAGLPGALFPVRGAGRPALVVVRQPPDEQGQKGLHRALRRESHNFDQYC